MSTPDYQRVALPKPPSFSSSKNDLEYRANRALFSYLWSNAGYVKRILGLAFKQSLPIRDVFPAVVSLRATCEFCKRTWHPFSVISAKNAPGGGAHMIRFVCHECKHSVDVRLEYKDFTNELVVKLDGLITLDAISFRELPRPHKSS